MGGIEEGSCEDCCPVDVSAALAARRTHPPQHNVCIFLHSSSWIPLPGGLLLANHSLGQSCLCQCSSIDAMVLSFVPRDVREFRIEKAVNTHLRELYTSQTINKTVYDKLRSTHGVAPQLYGLPKIHKPGVPMRPIVSCIGSPTYRLAKELTRVISPLAGNNFAYVKDSGDFVEKIRNIQLSEADILVSFDVKSPFYPGSY